MYIQNATPDFWESPHDNCNCGSFALNVPFWFCPYDDADERDAYIYKMVDEGYDREEIEELILGQDKRYLLNSFRATLHPINKQQMIDSAPDQTIIAYRIGIHFLGENDFIEAIDTDFHFKVRLNGEWWEKNGTGPIHPCELIDDNVWCASNRDNSENANDILLEDNFSYDSQILYFIVERYAYA